MYVYQSFSYKVHVHTSYYYYSTTNQIYHRYVNIVLRTQSVNILKCYQPTCSPEWSKETLIFKTDLYYTCICAHACMFACEQYFCELLLTLFGTVALLCTLNMCKECCAH